jgi:hypothetical protein
MALIKIFCTSQVVFVLPPFRFSQVVPLTSLKLLIAHLLHLAAICARSTFTIDRVRLPYEFLFQFRVLATEL